jgi:hypothetical protein
MELKFRKQFPSRKLLEIVSSTRIWKIQHNAAIIIQRAWRAHIRRKNAPLDIAKSTQTLRASDAGGHGLGHAFNKIGQFFHVGEHSKRRKSSVRDPAFLVPHRRTSVSADGNIPKPPLMTFSLGTLICQLIVLRTLTTKN